MSAEQKEGGDMRNILVLLLALLFFPIQEAHAIGDQYGRISGIVYSPEGAELPGVRITLTGSSLLGGPRNLSSADDGSFTFNNLSPGKYDLKFQQPGLKTINKTGITVSVGKTASIYMVMELPTTQDEITVVAEKPVIDTSDMTQGGSFSADLAKDVPTGRSYQDVATLLPGVIDINGGNPDIHGGTFRNNKYLVDGLDITDPVTLTFSANMNFDAIQEVEVLTGGLDAEYNALGGIINVVTKSGSNDFEMDASYYINNKTLSPQQDFENSSVLGGKLKERTVSQSINAASEANINLGGPLIKDKLWYYGSISRVTNLSTVENTAPFFQAHDPRNFEGIFGRLKLTYQPNQNNTITVAFNTDPAKIENSVQATNFFTDPLNPANSAEDFTIQNGYFISTRLDHVFSANLLFKAQAGWSHQRLAIIPQALVNDGTNVAQRAQVSVNRFTGVITDSGAPRLGTAGRALDPINFLPSQHQDLDLGLAVGGGNTVTQDLRDRLQLDSTLTFVKDKWFGSHEFKAGIQAAPTFNTFSVGTPGFGTFLDSGGQIVDNDGPGKSYVSACDASFDPITNTTVLGDTGVTDGCFLLNTTGGDPSENASTSFSTGVDAGIFIQDEWKPTPFITVKPGFRFDTFSSRQVVEEVGDEDGDGLLGESIKKSGVGYSGFGPRFGMAWDPTKDGKTLISGYVGQITESGNLVLPEFIGRSTEINFFPFNGSTYDLQDPFLTFGGDGGTLLACDDRLLNDPSTSFLFEECRPPVLRELSFIAERQVGNATKIGVSTIFRHQYHMFEDDEANLVFDERGVNVVGAVNGDPSQSVFRVRTPDEAFLDYKGVDFYISGKPSERSQLLASYSLSRSIGTKAEDTNSQFTIFMDNPRQNTFFIGPTLSDTPHAVKLTGSYDFDFGLSMGVTYQYLSGGRFDRLFFNDTFQGFTDRRAPRGFDPGEDLNDPTDDFVLQLPDINQIDIRGQYSLAPITGQNMIFIVDIFNVLNRRTPTAINQSEDGSFGVVEGRQFPTQIQLGIRYIY
jgi:hypothetical protein